MVTNVALTMALRVIFPSSLLRNSFSSFFALGIIPNVFFDLSVMNRPPRLVTLLYLYATIYLNCWLNQLDINYKTISAAGSTPCINTDSRTS
jgi:hypothetical protein